MQDRDEAEAPGRPFERRLATILMADVVGYSRMMEANEERTLRVFRGHREVFDALLLQHRGRIFNTAGDAVLAEFPSAVDAVRCATEIQSALRTRNDHLPPEERMQFRIGVNLGDVIVQGTDLLGDGVNVAARIQTVAEPGGVCLSGSVYDQIRNKLSLEFQQMGEQTFKNISQPIRVFAVGEGPEGTVRHAPKPPPAAPVRRWSAGALAAAVFGLALALAAGWWYVREREAQAVEVARATAAARAEEAVRAAEAARKKAEEATAASAVAEREAKLKAELAAAQREAAEAKRRAENARLPVAPPAAPGLAARAASSPPLVQAAAAPPAPATHPHDGAYRGRVCWEMPASAQGPKCWNVDLSVAHGKIDSTWVGKYGGGRSSQFRGTLSAQGAIVGLYEGFNLRGVRVTGQLAGHAGEGRLAFSGSLSNGVLINCSATRAP